jgi:hypothetical protein
VSAAEAALDTQTRQLDEQEGKRDPNRDRQGRLARLVLAGTSALGPASSAPYLLRPTGS